MNLFKRNTKEESPSINGEFLFKTSKEYFVETIPILNHGKKFYPVCLVTEQEIVTENPPQGLIYHIRGKFLYSPFKKTHVEFFETREEADNYASEMNKKENVFINKFSYYAYGTSFVSEVIK